MEDSNKQESSAPTSNPDKKESPIELKKSSKLPILIIVLLLILIVPLGGYFLFNEASKAKVAPTPSPTGSKQQITNPASTYCESQGGKEEIVTAPDGSQDGVCVLNDGHKCNSWDFYRTKKCSASTSPSPTSENKQSFLEVPEFGVKFALTDSIKDAYELPATANKGYVYLKVHSLDSEPQCAKDNSSTAALSKVGKDEVNPMSGAKYSDSGNGAIIGNYYYYIDLAQYECAQSVSGKTLLTNVRKAFSDASKTITQL